ncbi:diacylglycerol lipase-beta-like [Argiope bruennichi]|uniref:sn-1-specific diacylglycerol lipase n=1 Tax=Argiope bruennichi TaxID=94029 RepID=A0A8T0ENH8_ARGBR|nr:diacylglycerol lipase-beta-like [Argiope bruennichi]XP_055943945.1 diacylglycerol lipase-beta-like [Argiope bruennichi]XP_055943946.1 diacylglycerol lipase-beta-like [Argiope bruennichi]XP_055943947.1 diacylglycerol lipase-beta-like [Argiope bruennichi]XP_055943948.1 diacylglycerol lipase-beta-like [Argiope bruennichi]XP_055943949.1 diacylglycerol lipase-beta-like [Argiope bruennichi]KAF8776834.1 Sn1-specific diacylglycerol lipase beta like protein [Argiope bruennichi]
MPGIVIFKRRWRIGSDDFVFPALAEFFLRLIWFVVVLVLFLKHLPHLKCSGERLLHTYLILSLAGLGFILLLDALIAWISSRGTVVQTRPRRHLCKILYLRLLVMIMEIVWNGIGTKWAFTPADHVCEPKEVITLVQVIAICSWVVLGIMIFGIILVFDPVGSYRNNGSGHRVADVERGEPQALYINLNRNPEKAKKIWEWQIRLFCCCCNQDEQSKNAYSDISKLFTYWFEDVDLVPSDIAAGLILLQQKQATESGNRVSTSQHSENFSVQSPDSLTSTGAVQGSIISSPGVFTPPANQFWMTPELACHFMKFAQGSYGWPVFLYTNIFTGMCQIWKHIRCCACCCKPTSYIIDDNCCECHTAVLKQVTGLSDEDLIFVSFHNRVYEIPFFVAIDHQTCSVVVSIRGTLSLSDTLTDLSTECVKIIMDGCSQGVSCHGGMLRAALFIKNKLEESHALSDAFALHQSYSLAITGHSLGAGAAALLAVLLRPIYPNLRCYSFSPPGGLMSLEGVKYTEDFVMSIALGDDLVPRLSVPNIEDMKRKLLNCISDCEQPKCKIFLHKLFDCIGKKPSQTDASTAPLSRPLLEHFGQTNSCGNYTTNSSQEGSSESSVSSGQTAVHSRHSAPVPLYIPGRMLHLSRTDSGYNGRWVSYDYFNQIIISPTMLSDHMVYNVYNALKQLVSSSGNFP